ncbi:MAG: YkgJ family cysteine cluster protein [Moraxellaceae bacterium]
MSESSPCQQCGACCAHFRVSFYWAEADDAEGGTVPAHLTNQRSPTLRCMKGTDSSRPRCIALEGDVGGHVSCGIYASRPSPCREVMPGDEQCLRARAAHGLPPLTPATPCHAA